MDAVLQALADRAGAPCSRSCATTRPRPANSPTHCRSPGRASPGTCGCCGRPDWSTSARRPSGGSTASARRRWPRWTQWLEPYRALWRNRLDALHTEIARGKKDSRNHHEDHRHHASARRQRAERCASRTSTTPTSTTCGRRAPTPERLARWIAEVSGDLRVGGTVHAVFTSTWTGPGRIDVCEPRTICCSRWSPDTEDEAQIEAWLTRGGRPDAAGRRGARPAARPAPLLRCRLAGPPRGPRPRRWPASSRSGRHAGIKLMPAYETMTLS